MIQNQNLDRLLAQRLAEETARFHEQHPGSIDLHSAGAATMIGGVPMQWMSQWATPSPIFVSHASGGHVWDVDGNRYVDFCMGDMASTFGHSNEILAEHIADQAKRGLSFLLPTADSVAVGKLLADRFGLPFWQIAGSATDANRFSIRLARHVTGRPKILVFNGCYHGAVDETLVCLDGDRVVPQPGNIGPGFDPALTTRIVEFNDVAGLEKALLHGDVACVLCEPAMTNIGTILPEPGYHAELRRLTRKYGTLLLIDEAHTICAGPAGGTGFYGLDPDIITLGKPMANGVPAAASGYSAAVAERIAALTGESIFGIGGTLSGNAMALRAMRVTLEHIITQAAFDIMLPLADRLEAGIRAIIDDFALPWHVNRLGARVEYRLTPTPPRCGSEAKAGEWPELENYIHLFLANRGILLTPFQNILIVSPGASEADVDQHNDALRGCVQSLLQE